MVLFENLPRPAHGFFLRIWKIVKTFPERFSGSIFVLHLREGGTSVSATSMSTPFSGQGIGDATTKVIRHGSFGQAVDVLDYQLALRGRQGVNLCNNFFCAHTNKLLPPEDSVIQTTRELTEIKLEILKSMELFSRGRRVLSV